MKYLLNCRSFISLMVLFSFFDNFGMEGETDEDYDYLFKVVFVGDKGVGKTQIIDKFVENKFSENCASTIGMDFKVKMIKYNGKNIKLQLWDSSGNEQIRNTIKNLYNGSNLIVLVYAVDDKNSFDSIPKLVDEVKKQIKNPKFLLVGNKCDLDEKKYVSTEEAQKYAENNEMESIEVSAKNGTNIDDMFKSSIEKLLKDMKKEKNNNPTYNNPTYNNPTYNNPTYNNPTYIEHKIPDYHIQDIDHIENKKDSCWSEYCSCCLCLKKTKGNVEE